jgi:hypothetical protein
MHFALCKPHIILSLKHICPDFMDCCFYSSHNDVFNLSSFKSRIRITCILHLQNTNSPKPSYYNFSTNINGCILDEDQRKLHKRQVNKTGNSNTRHNNLFQHELSLTLRLTFQVIKQYASRRLQGFLLSAVVVSQNPKFRSLEGGRGWGQTVGGNQRDVNFNKHNSV